MKRITLIIISILVTLMVTGQKQSEQQLAKAIHEEEVNGDLEKAMPLYKEIVKLFPNDRNAVAEALYRIGLSHEKMGNREARKYYKNIINNYSDQTKQVQLARARLNALLNSLDIVEKEKSISVQKIYSLETFYGSVSNDGRHALTTNWDDANLYYVDMVNNTNKPVTTKGTWTKPISYADYAIFSPDNKKIAYSWYEEQKNGGVYQLIVKDIQNGNSNILVEFDEGFVYPVEWTTDGKKILTIGGNKINLSVGLLDLNTKAHKIYKTYSRNGKLFESFPSISPDSKYILYNLTQSDYDRNILMISTSDGSEMVVSDHASDEWGVKWCNDGTGFTYASDRAGNAAIYKMTIEQGIPSNVPVMVYESVSKSYRPLTITNEGRLIYMNKHSFSDIYLADFNLEEGLVTNNTMMYDQANHLFAPVWSNKSDKLALILKQSNKRSEDQLLIRNMITGEEKIIDLGVRVVSVAALPYWSHDDKRLLMEFQGEGGFGLIIVDIQDETLNKIMNIGRPAVFGPGNSILVGKHYTPHLVKLDLDTQQPDTIFTGNNSCQDLKVSPDQKYLSFNDWGDEQKLMIMNLATKKTEVIWEIGNTQSFLPKQSWWLPDNETLVVVLGDLDKNSKPSKFQIYTINIKTKEKKKVGPLFTDSEGFISSFELNSKGNKIVYKKAMHTENVWILKF